VIINRAGFGLTCKVTGMASINNTPPSTPPSPSGERMRGAGTGATDLTGSTVARLPRSGGDEIIAPSRNHGRSRSAGLGEAPPGDRQPGTHRNTDERQETDERLSGHR
jgi:hypothetical protein